MSTVKAGPSDLIEVLYLLKVCVADMNEQGYKHWNNAYPGADLMSKSIEKGELYLYKERGICKGMVILSEEEPEDYKKIEWQGGTGKVLFIKFLAVHPMWQGKGVAKQLLGFIETFAKQYNYKSMRIDVYSAIEAGQKMCDDMGFKKTGQFHSTFQSAPHLAYEKAL